MTRLTTFLLLVGILFAFRPTLLAPTESSHQSATRPNILWLSCEDMSPHLSCYAGSPAALGNTVPTPNIDRLAREGVRFTNAFCTAGVCAPSRNAIITGMYQTATGGHNMRTLNDTYPQKTGLPKQYSIVPSPTVRAFPEYLRAITERGPGYYTTNNEKTDYQFDHPPTVWDEVSRTATYQNRPPGAPFFAVFNNVVTHESQVWVRAKLPLRVNPDSVQVPPYYPDTKIVRQDIARFLSNIRDMDDWVGEKLAQLEKDGLLDNTIIFFWSDHGDGLPFVKREIYDRGIRVPLIVRFPDKRSAGTTQNNLTSMIDLAPTVLSLAGIPTPAHMQGQAFYGPYAAKKPRQHIFAARDRLDSEYDRVRTVHDGRYQYVRNFEPNKPLYMDVAFRKQQPMMAEILQLRDAGKLNRNGGAIPMRWFTQTKPMEELYDIQKDPYELQNLATDPAYASHLKRLRRVFDQWQRDVPDLGAIPEKEMVNRWWNDADVPPVTADPILSRTVDKITLQCDTEGASIGYRLGEERSWRVYTGPFALPANTPITVVAQRIGYQKSKEISQML